MAPTLDEQIAQSLRDSQRSGELEAAPSRDAAGTAHALQDAEGRSQLALLDCEPTPAVAALRHRLVDLNANLALRLERLRVAGSL